MLINSSKGRYYSQIDQQYDRCKNCDELGHIGKNCPTEFIQRCYYCLGPHHKEKCEMNYCFLCAADGHRSTNCPDRHKRTCRRCNKKGHIESDCSILVNFRDINYRLIEHSKIDRRLLKCASCDGEGHVQCYIKGNDTVKTISRDGLYNHDDMKRTLIDNNIPLEMLYDEDGLGRKQILSKNQKRKRLNELITDEVEDRTLQEYKSIHNNRHTHNNSNNRYNNDDKYLKKRYPAHRDNERRYETENNTSNRRRKYR